MNRTKFGSVSISVVIPCYNAFDYVDEAIMSVLNQTRPPNEIIVVDDGSTDRSCDVILKYQSRVTLLRQENKGAGSARNYGISQCSGDYVAFLDADDIWLPDTLAAVEAQILEYNCNVVLGYEKNNAYPYNYVGLEGIRSECFRNVFEAVKKVDYWLCLSPALVVKRDVLAKVGGFAEGRKNAEDAHLFLKLGLIKGCVVIADPPLFFYRKHETNNSGSISKNLLGIQYLMDFEKAGHYPGGNEFSKERTKVITMHSRAASITCLNSNRILDGYNIYCKTFFWNLSHFRFKYIFGFPMLFCLRFIRALIRYK